MRTPIEDQEATRLLTELQRIALRLWELGVDPCFVTRRDVEGFAKDGVERGSGLALRKREGA